jgi:hypothetical protein
MYREPPKGFDLDELRDAVAAAYRLGGEEAAARVLRFFRLPVPCPRCCGTADDPEWRKSAGKNVEWRRVAGKGLELRKELGREGANWGAPAICEQCHGDGAVERRDNPACRWKLWGVPIRLALSGKVT